MQEIFIPLPPLRSPCNTILTLLYKSLIAQKEFVKLVRALEKGPVSLTPPRGESKLFPQALTCCAKIDFRTMTTQEIISLIRGVTKPFSGAFVTRLRALNNLLGSVCV